MTRIELFLQKGMEPSRYLNWDRLEDRVKILSSSYDPVIETLPRTPALKPLVIFNEIHKYKDWKNYFIVLSRADFFCE
jgi:hypothetical protein